MSTNCPSASVAIGASAVDGLGRTLSTSPTGTSTRSRGHASAGSPVVHAPVVPASVAPEVVSPAPVVGASPPLIHASLTAPGPPPVLVPASVLTGPPPPVLVLVLAPPTEVTPGPEPLTCPGPES